MELEIIPFVTMLSCGISRHSKRWHSGQRPYCRYNFRSTPCKLCRARDQGACCMSLKPTGKRGITCVWLRLVAVGHPDPAQKLPVLARLVEYMTFQLADRWHLLPQSAISGPPPLQQPGPVELAELPSELLLQLALQPLPSFEQPSLFPAQHWPP